MARLHLASPWVLYYQKVKALFGEDPDIHIVLDDEEMELKIYVEGEDRAEALEKIFSNEQSWGDISLKTVVVPANTTRVGLFYPKLTSWENIFKTAFYYNPHFSHCVYVDGILSNGLTYVIFRNEVIQYYSDDLGDVNGITSILAEDLARQLFKDIDGVFYCTNIPEM